jgi:hypothetical protein
MMPITSRSAPQYHEEEEPEEHGDDRRCCGMTHSYPEYRPCVFADAKQAAVFSLLVSRNVLRSILNLTFRVLLKQLDSQMCLGFSIRERPPTTAPRVRTPASTAQLFDSCS